MKWFRAIDWRKIEQKKYEMAFKVDIGLNYIGDEFKNHVIDPDIKE